MGESKRLDPRASPRHRAKHLRATATAPGSARKKGSYLQTQLGRLRHRRGPKKAVCAVAASILTAAFHMLEDGTTHTDLGADHFKRASPESQAKRLAQRIEKLGSTCTFTAQAGEGVSV